jgi:hypothetical protein
MLLQVMVNKEIILPSSTVTLSVMHHFIFSIPIQYKLRYAQSVNRDELASIWVVKSGITDKFEVFTAHARYVLSILSRMKLKYSCSYSK